MPQAAAGWAQSTTPRPLITMNRCTANANETSPNAFAVTTEIPDPQSFWLGVPPVMKAWQ